MQRWEVAKTRKNVSYDMSNNVFTDVYQTHAVSVRKNPWRKTLKEFIVAGDGGHAAPG